MQPRSVRKPITARKHMRMDILAILIGVAGGLGAVVFRWFIKFFHYVFFDLIYSYIDGPEFQGYKLGLVLLPTLGGLIIGPVIYKYAPETRGHGVPEVIEALILRHGRIRSRVAAIKILVSSITIGSGGSAGREGPIAQIGASIASITTRLVKLDPYCSRLLVACGLAAGIAGTFNAPLGGALFGGEVLLRGIGLFDAIPLILASVIGAATASIFLGQHPSFYVPKTPVWNPIELPIYLLHGAIMGVIAYLWVKSFYGVEGIFNKLPIKGYLKLGLGGLGTGSLIATMPQYGVGGVGYEGVEMALLGVLPPMLMLVLGISKLLSTSLTIGSGGSGGVFAPSLYIGSMFGGVLATIYFNVFPSAYLGEPLGYELAGMAALFAGAAQAPLTVIVMIPEMSGSYSLIPPIMASAGMSFIVAWILLKGRSIYTIKLIKRGLAVKTYSSYILDLVRVEDVMTRNVVSIPADAPLFVVDSFFVENVYGGYPVVDRKTRRVVGIITRMDLDRVKKHYEKEERKKLKAIDIATRKLLVVTPDATVRGAHEIMTKHGVSRLPVVNSPMEMKLVGIITMRDILKAYEIITSEEQ
ncbi:MAG: chloride channel protein [Desulfurococcales archaeon]|nr:chloride channel protein [Desulfurococcales archaeon]